MNDPLEQFDNFCCPLKEEKSFTSDVGTNSEVDESRESDPQIDENHENLTDPEAYSSPTNETDPEGDENGQYERDPEVPEVNLSRTKETDPEADEKTEEGASSRPVVEINNICCKFNLRCKLDLFDVAARAISIEYDEGAV